MAEEKVPVVPVEDFLAQLEAEHNEREKKEGQPADDGISIPGAAPAITGPGGRIVNLAAPSAGASLAPSPESLPVAPGDVGATSASGAPTIMDDGSGEGGIWLQGAKLNDVFQFLARLGKLQYFHNAELEGPTFVVTGHLRDGEPVRQMEELGLMYGVTILQKGGTVYALTASQTGNLPSKPLQYKLNYLRPTDITAIKTMLAPMLTPGTGFVEFEAKTNTLIIVDNEQKVKFVLDVLKEMDQPKRQIAIETRILRIKSSSRNRVGVDWSTVLGNGMTVEATEALNALFNLPDSDVVREVVTLATDRSGRQGYTIASMGRLGAPAGALMAGSVSSTIPESNTKLDISGDLLGNEVLSGFSSESGGTAGHNGTNSYTRTTDSTASHLVLSPLQLQATLRALHAGGMAEQESSPTLITEDNEMGVISVIDRVPIIVSTVSETSAGQNITEEVRYRVDPEDTTDDPTKTREIGVSVTVTPTILPDNTIRMKLRPRSAQIVDFVEGRSGNLFPRVNESSVETIARIPDSYSLMVGGFYEESSSNQTNKVPLLGDVPGLGFFFKSTDKQKENTSLVFIVTPKLYEPMSIPQTIEMTRNLQQRHVLPGDHNWPDRQNPGNNYEPNMRWTLGNLFNRYPAHKSRHVLNPEASINHAGFGPVELGTATVVSQEPASPPAAASSAPHAEVSPLSPAGPRKSRFSLFGRRRN